MERLWQLTVGLIEKDTVLMSEDFSETKSLGVRVKVDLDLPNYAAKTVFKLQQVLIHEKLLKKLNYLI